MKNAEPSFCLALLVMAGSALLSSSALMPGRAHAFGGLSPAAGARLEQVAERIIFVDHPGPTITAIVQIASAGPAQKFAWVVPVPGKVSVSVSSNAVFERLDAVTAPRFWSAVEVTGTCLEDHPFDLGDQGASPPAPAPLAALPSSSVWLTDRGSVGPYDYVNIALDPATPEPELAVVAWLTTNGYDPSGLDRAALGDYVREGLGLLAFKLTKGPESGATRPVMLTYEGKLPSIPLRPTAASARGELGLQVWVFGPTQAVPDNYPSLVLNDALIDWSSARKFAAGALPAGGAGPFGPELKKPRSYEALVGAAADEAGGQGFVTELAGPASRVRSQVWGALDAETFATISATSYADGIEAIVAAREHYGGWDGFEEAIEGATTLPQDLTLEAFARDPSKYRGAVAVDVAEFLRLLGEKVRRPVADTAALLSGTPYLTRLYTKLGAPEMTRDPRFAYNYELDQVSHVRVAKQFVQCSPALRRPEDAPWYMNLPQGGVVLGEGERWPLGVGALPATLQVVALSAQGPGRLVVDHRPLIGAKLHELAGTTGQHASLLRPPQHGLAIGGSQRVKRPVP
jgi:hypothetical protein